jgi:DNA helicase HerA-like ATPase
VVVTATVRGRGNILISNYHGRLQVELLGEELEDGGTVPPRRRPLPNSPVFPLSPDETSRVLRTSGAVRLGVAESHDDIEVRIPTTKSVLPRHLGVLGTTGGGKSTTVASLIAQFQQAGVACILLDTEGEYTAVSQPTEDHHMRQALSRRGLEPAGVPNSHVYHLAGRETTNPKHPSRTQFYLAFDRLSPYTVTEILELSEAQRGRYWQAYELTKTLLREFGVFPSRRPGQADQEERQALELDDFESGYPRMTLSHLLDISLAFLHVISKDEGPPRLYNQVFKDHADRLVERVRAASIRDTHADSWRALRARLWQLRRLNIFDLSRQDAAPINYSEMVAPGRVSIVDLSDMDTVDVKNLVIADLIRGIQMAQEDRYHQAISEGTELPRTMIFIEEAHEFLSAQRVQEMPVLFQQVARISRRGRKRWLGLVFVTQLPQHLPDEVLGLVNNWILHKISDSNVVSRLRRSIGGIDDSLWGRLPNLAPGQAVVSFTSLARPLLVAVDPTPCKLLMVE